VTWSVDGKVASGSGDKTIKIWNTNTGQCVSTLTGHSSAVRAVSWSPDGSMLASGSDDYTIKLWDTQKGKQESHVSECPLRGLESRAFISMKDLDFGFGSHFDEME